VLSRGYAIVLNERGEIVKDSGHAPADSEIQVLFQADSLRARVIKSQ